MKTIKKNVYYCDFCKKRSLSGWHLKNHEKHCTNNPNRECRACGGSVNVADIVDGYKKRFELVADEIKDEWGQGIVELSIKWIGEEITMSEIDEDTDGCPFCKLSVIRQAELNRFYFKDMFKFSYKDEAADFMANKRMESARQDYYGQY